MGEGVEISLRNNLLVSGGVVEEAVDGAGGFVEGHGLDEAVVVEDIRLAVAGEVAVDAAEVLVDDLTALDRRDRGGIDLHPLAQDLPLLRREDARARRAGAVLNGQHLEDVEGVHVVEGVLGARHREVAAALGLGLLAPDFLTRLLELLGHVEGPVRLLAAPLRLTARLLLQRVVVPATEDVRGGDELVSAGVAHEVEDRAAGLRGGGDARAALVGVGAPGAMGVVGLEGVLEREEARAAFDVGGDLREVGPPGGGSGLGRVRRYSKYTRAAMACANALSVSSGIMGFPWVCVDGRERDGGQNIPAGNEVDVVDWRFCPLGVSEWVARSGALNLAWPRKGDRRPGAPPGMVAPWGHSNAADYSTASQHREGDFG